jgi:F-type H+-transporting ATPase subunit a
LVSYLKPSWLLLPLNLISELSRTLALSMRLFGNMMSGGVMTGVVAGLGALILAGLPVIVIGIPLRMLAIFSGVVQAYIFVALALVFIGAAVRGQPKPEAISREASHG